MDHFKVLIIAAILISNMSCNSFDSKPLPKEATVVFYNVENLFDIYDDPFTSDNDFTPEGSLNWTKEKYETKLKRIEEVLISIDPSGPDLIGLCEVENRMVLEELFQTGQLKNKPYQIIHEDGNDTRGIDMAFVYNPEVFEYDFHQRHEISFPWNPDIKSRAIIEIHGKINNEPITFFLNHWPSRRNGAKKTAKKRFQTADVLRKAIEQIISENEDANIVVMGDFNDQPNNKSIKNLIIGIERPNKSLVLKNLMSAFHNQNIGTCVYDDKWYIFDQIWASNTLFNTHEPIFIKPSKAYIFQNNHVLYNTKDNRSFPHKTYGGDKYYGGYSDHLAVYCRIQLKH